MTDLNELDSECKICLVSHLPMAMTLASTSNIRRRKILDEGLVQGPPASAMQGLTGNEYAIDSWKDYYQLSLKRAEEGLKNSKQKWFNTEHDRWQS